MHPQILLTLAFIAIPSFGASLTPKNVAFTTINVRHHALNSIHSTPQITNTQQFDKIDTSNALAVTPITTSPPNGIANRASSSLFGLVPISDPNWGGTSFRAQLTANLQQEFVPTAAPAYFGVEPTLFDSFDSFDLHELWMGCILGTAADAFLFAVPCTVRFNALTRDGAILGTQVLTYKPKKECLGSSGAPICLPNVLARQEMMFFWGVWGGVSGRRECVG